MTTPLLETMHAAGRRSLPPVPRAAAEGAPIAEVTTAGEAGSVDDAPEAQPDAAQAFVARLRSAAADFAAAAGAQSAVVREAVPPARHRRSRCRLVLRYPDGAESDLTFLGPVGSPGRQARLGFDRQIQRWLGAGQVRDASWLVADPDAEDGLAVDVSAWLAAS